MTCAGWVYKTCRLFGVLKMAKAHAFTAGESCFGGRGSDVSIFLKCQKVMGFVHVVDSVNSLPDAVYMERGNVCVFFVVGWVYANACVFVVAWRSLFLCVLWHESKSHVRCMRIWCGAGKTFLRYYTGDGV